MKNLFLAFAFLCFACQNFQNSSSNTLPKTTFNEDLSGKQLYIKHCAVCHQKDAIGIKGVFPPIKNSDYFLEDPKRAIHNILFGQSEPIIVNGVKYNSLMPPIKITDNEVVKVVNYLLGDVNIVDDRISLKDVDSVRQTP